ncbi:lytic transglycosylase domain-containing protein [Anaeroselena agilis]|uniref:Lytic transglycosylase domain-containing protein n=1 Tax=Anaeroselena agilis TaxID=3063788 RepID=A0ABU3P165_9FIRM|nr:lytic transglycosylase domain-containing protein [Selenomonadales bacterium 4137-cl]
MVWYLLLALLAAETALYFAAGWAAGVCRQAARRDFNAAAGRWREVDKVPFAGLINLYAREEGVSAAMVAAIIRAESSFQPRAVSRAGAAGLMQIIPGTWREVNGRIRACSGRHEGECGPGCYFDPELNIRIGTAYFAALVRQYRGDLVLALAAYNAGPGAVDRCGGVPPYPETQEYVARVMAYWHEFAGLQVPAGGGAAENWEAARRAAAWGAAATAALAVWTALRLLRRHRSWRWR